MGNNKSALGFGSNTTAEEVSAGIDMTGKVVVITGANVGIGKEAARVLAMRGAHVIIGCRDQTKGTTAANEIAQSTGGKCDFLQLDLSSFESVKSFANSFKEKNLPLHVLINNAGIMACPWATTAEGHESQFGVCHLGHFLLTGLLIDKLKESAPSRVVVLASEANRYGNADVINPPTEESKYNRYTAYGNAKLANVLFALELHKRLKGTGVIANSVHPGVIQTELTRNDTLAKIFFTLGKPFLKSIPQGAATTLFTATHPSLNEANSGKYFADCQESKPQVLGTDENLASQLWTLSEKLTGIKFLSSEPTL